MYLLAYILSGYRNHSLHLTFHIIPYLFIRIEFWRVSGQEIKSDLLLSVSLFISDRVLLQPFLNFLGLVGWMTIEDESVLLRRSVDDSLQENDEGITCERSFIGHKFHNSIFTDSRCCIDTKPCSCGCYNGSLSFESPGSSAMLCTLKTCLISVEDFSLFCYCLSFNPRSFYLSPFFHLLKFLLIGSKYRFLIRETKIFEYLSYLSFFEFLEEYLFDKFSDYRRCPEGEFKLKLFDISRFQEEKFFQLLHLRDSKIFLRISWLPSRCLVGFESLPSSFSVYPEPFGEECRVYLHEIADLGI